eukprot:XP_001699430.1 aldo-keto-reductase-like protein [Chlamydomonas reinhardtii]
MAAAATASSQGRPLALPRTITLRNGVELPTVGLGTFKAGGDEARGAVLAALKAGIRHIDTASIYKDLVLVHWPGVARTPPDSAANAQQRAATWSELQQLYREGRVRSLGVSNYEEPHVAELMADPAAEVLLRWALQEGCAVIPKSVRPERLAEWTEPQLLGADWGLSGEQMAALAAMEDGHKYCWDPSGIVRGAGGGLLLVRLLLLAGMAVSEVVVAAGSRGGVWGQAWRAETSCLDSLQRWEMFGLFTEVGADYTHTAPVPGAVNHCCYWCSVHPNNPATLPPRPPPHTPSRAIRTPHVTVTEVVVLPDSATSQSECGPPPLWAPATAASRPPPPPPPVSAAASGGPAAGAAAVASAAAAAAECTTQNVFDVVLRSSTVFLLNMSKSPTPC